MRDQTQLAVLAVQAAGASGGEPPEVVGLLRERSYRADKEEVIVGRVHENMRSISSLSLIPDITDFEKVETYSGRRLKLSRAAARGSWSYDRESDMRESFERVMRTPWPWWPRPFRDFEYHTTFDYDEFYIAERLRDHVAKSSP